MKRGEWPCVTMCLLPICSVLVAGAIAQVNAVHNNYTPRQPEIDGFVWDDEWLAAERVTLLARGGTA